MHEKYCRDLLQTAILTSEMKYSCYKPPLSLAGRYLNVRRGPKLFRPRSHRWTGPNETPNRKKLLGALPTISTTLLTTSMDMTQHSWRSLPWPYLRLSDLASFHLTEPSPRSRNYCFLPRTLILSVFIGWYMSSGLN